jgi:hypothetical protein
MRKFKVSRVWKLGITFILMFTLFGLTPSAQEPGQEEASTAQMGAPSFEEFKWEAKPPTLTDEQKAQMEYWVEHTGLPGPMLEQAVTVAGPAPGTESRQGPAIEAADTEEETAAPRALSGQALAPGDPVIFRKKVNAGAGVPAGNKFNIMETSVGASGKYVFLTGNKFAALSGSGGRSWQYVNPWSGFPDFCCDQVTLYDEARDIFLWLRMGSPDANGENRFMLSVSKKDAVSWWTYVTPSNPGPGGWTNQWWDYPHIQLGADYAYIAWNMFDWNGTGGTTLDDFWVRTVMLRWPLDALATGAGFGYNWMETTDWFTFVPVQGAYHTMYWASNWPTYSTDYNFRIWRWQEDETTIYWWDRIIPAWTPTGRGDAHCGSPNWAARYDQRVLTGARYSINSPGLQEPKILGRKILAWWWNVAEGGDFPLPYIDAAAFYEDNLTQVGGWLGRPLVWGDWCFAYPSCTPNKRQDLGMVFNYADAWDNDYRPHVGYAIADDYIHAPPGWVFYPVQKSKALPSDEVWGDYNTCREYEPTQKVWVAGAHYIPGTTNCSFCSEPVYFVFGRERDYWSFHRWRSR